MFGVELGQTHVLAYEDLCIFVAVHVVLLPGALPSISAPSKHTLQVYFSQSHRFHLISGQKRTSSKHHVISIHLILGHWQICESFSESVVSPCPAASLQCTSHAAEQPLSAWTSAVLTDVRNSQRPAGSQAWFSWESRVPACRLPGCLVWACLVHTNLKDANHFVGHLQQCLLLTQLVKIVLEYVILSLSEHNTWQLFSTLQLSSYWFSFGKKILLFQKLWSAGQALVQSGWWGVWGVLVRS